MELCGQARGGGTCLKSTTSGPLLSIYKCITEPQRRKMTEQKSHSMLVTLLELQPVLLSPCPVFTGHTVTEKELEDSFWAKPGPPLPSMQGSPGPRPRAPAGPYLEQCSCHVEDDEDECKSGVPALHTADGVEEHQMSWDHEEKEDPGRARIHIWNQGRDGVRRRGGGERAPRGLSKSGGTTLHSRAADS